MFTLTYTFVLVLAATHTAAWTWPDPKLAALDHARWDQTGYHGGAVNILIEPCNQWLGSLNSGRANAADWIRTAYHDMATHNVDDGTGGLDSSIRFDEELGRPENAGNSFVLAIVHLGSTVNHHVSLADAIAVALVISVEHCQGPEIAFRGGRIDADAPGPAGVPQPQESLSSHIQSFRRQGFTQEEMIGLVACGHTFGGVQHDFFPDIVPELNDDNNTQSSAHFDTTFFTFDNNVAKEWISGKTTNPLVIAANDTMNSDKRIFGSDRNRTMSSFARSPQLFFNTCGKLFARMIDTVPRHVKLTDVIEPIPVKPYALDLLYGPDGVLQLTSDVRLWNRTASSMKVLVKGENGHVTAATATHTPQMVGSATGGRYSSSWFTFSVNVSTATSMSFEIDGRLENQGGKGYALPNTVMFATSSCSPDGQSARYDVAVRRDVKLKRLYIASELVDLTGKPVAPQTNFTKPPKVAGSYNIWTSAPVDFGPVFAVAELKDGSAVEAAWNSNPLFALPKCTP